MLIIFEDQMDLLQGRYVTLELDTIKFGSDGVPKTAYCVVENVKLQDMLKLDDLKSTHKNLIDSYKTQQWNECLESIENLTGQFNGELDTFYQDLATRVKKLQVDPPTDTWDPVIIKTI